MGVDVDGESIDEECSVIVAGLNGLVEVLTPVQASELSREPGGKAEVAGGLSYPSGRSEGRLLFSTRMKSGKTEDGRVATVLDTRFVQ